MPQDIAFARPYMGDSEAKAAADAVRSGWIVGGPRLAEFEARFADCCGAKHAVGTSSWTTGAFLVLYAWGIGPGDEVIVPSLTFIATVNVIRHVGATPVFAEIDARTFNLDLHDAERKITPRTKALLPVDQIGLPCDIDGANSLAQRYNIRVLDDAACAVASLNRGRPVGCLAEATVFSLHARKVISTAEGGMITTNDDELARRLRILRHQGMSLSDFARHSMLPTEFETYPEIGFNYRITDIQAAIGLAQIARLDEILKARRTIADRYTEFLDSSPLLQAPYVPAGLTPNWQSYQVRLRADAPLSRDEVMRRLTDAGVPTRRGVMASHREPPYKNMAASLPVTERVADSTLQLPMHPALTEEQQERIAEAIRTLL